jgi:hypothetical protein
LRAASSTKSSLERKKCSILLTCGLVRLLSRHDLRNGVEIGVGPGLSFTESAIDVISYCKGKVLLDFSADLSVFDGLLVGL